MASVQELRDALETEQTRAIELSDRALAAIDSVVGLTSLWTTLLGFGIALLALIGVGVIYIGSRRAASKIAQQRIQSYLEGDEVRQQIQAEVQNYLDRRALIMVTPPQAAEGGPEPFRAPPRREG